MLAGAASVPSSQELGMLRPEKVQDVAEATSETPRNDTEVNLKRTGKIPASFFYKEGRMRVRCNPPSWVIRIPRRAVPAMRITLDDWEDWSKIAPGAALWYAQRRQEQCYGCQCDENGGLYAISLVARKGTRLEKVRGCGTQFSADKCSVMLGCFCTADLIHPVPEDKTLPISVFQEALDSIPDTVQGHNPDYRWNYGGGTLRFTQPRRYLDPNNAAPYNLNIPRVAMDDDYFRRFRSIFGPDANFPGSGDTTHGTDPPVPEEEDPSGPSGPSDGDPGGSGSGGPGWSGGEGSGSGSGSGSAGTAKVKRDNIKLQSNRK
ncbi:hypothetical protein TWF481_005988 [Arthrobotrys musiformis]|uniref:Uncharacterized protein n=1 Tax=Arthrobotrys musiformis TaxID=47236 RepID=A0AAV9WFE2_9PEZI